MPAFALRSVPTPFFASQKSKAKLLEGFVRFINADAVLLKAIEAGKWTDFARGYNGPAYVRNQYDVKLERAFARYDTATQPKGAA